MSGPYERFGELGFNDEAKRTQFTQGLRSRAREMSEHAPYVFFELQVWPAGMCQQLVAPRSAAVGKTVEIAGERPAYPGREVSLEYFSASRAVLSQNVEKLKQDDVVALTAQMNRCGCLEQITPVLNEARSRTIRED